MTDSKQPAGRLQFIDAARAFACLWVLLHHSIGSDAATTPAMTPLVWFARLGWMGVSVFLVLSGFCLYFPLVRKFGVEGAAVDVKEFAARRIRRLVPTYYAAIVFALVLRCYIMPRYLHEDPWPFRWNDVIAHLLLIHNLSHNTFSGINLAFWSLALEAQLYLIFPALVLLARRRGLNSVVLTTFMISMAWSLFALHRVGPARYWDPTHSATYDAMPGHCFEFALGMLAASLVASPKPSLSRPLVALLLALTAIPCAAYVLFVARFGIGLYPAIGVATTCSLVLASNIPDDKFTTHRLLKWFAWCGSISYSIYLIHLPLFYLSEALFNRNRMGTLSTLLFVAVRAGVVIGLGAVFYRYFEKPYTVRPRPRK